MLVSPMYSKEIYKQLELIKETLALSALLSEEKIKGKILQRLRSIAFPEEIELWFAMHVLVMNIKNQKWFS